MTREEAEGLAQTLREERIDHDIRVVYVLGSAGYSVRAYLNPLNFESDSDDREQARRVIDLMTSEGDWHIGGEIGRAYVARY